MNKDSIPSAVEPKVLVDWSEVRRHMEKLEYELDRKATPSQAERRTILQSRGRALAREPAHDTMAQDLIEVIEFRLASETYAIEPAFVREVYPLKDYTPLPGTPDFVLGIINVRGQIMSIVDLRKFFNLTDKGLGQLNKVIIIRNGGMVFGILADAILGTERISLKDIGASPHSVTGIGASYLKGVTAQRVIVLDARKILEDDEIVVDEEAPKTKGA
jgi:purine-binding chemotaxis protein CheW